ncbi:MAG TPA: hypothetical protein VH328_11610 [Burkholderiaceae bacterium]|jgi:hypothetical protein|nr:hypothetical protein [Burkholderiaceae bacterium]
MDLDSAIALLELQVAAMSRALVAQDPAAAEAAAAELRNSLRTAMAPFAQAQRAGALRPDLRRRLARASGQIAAQREGVARASTVLDQTLTAMLPQPEAPLVYSAQGGSKRSSGRVIAAS